MAILTIRCSEILDSKVFCEVKIIFLESEASLEKWVSVLELPAIFFRKFSENLGKLTHSIKIQ